MVQGCRALFAVTCQMLCRSGEGNPRTSCWRTLAAARWTQPLSRPRYLVCGSSWYAFACLPAARRRGGICFLPLTSPTILPPTPVLAQTEGGDQDDKGDKKDGEGWKKRKGDERSDGHVEKRPKPDALQSALMSAPPPGAPPLPVSVPQQPPPPLDPPHGGFMKTDAGGGTGGALAGLSAVAVAAAGVGDADATLVGLPMVEEAKRDDKGKGKIMDMPKISGRFTKEEDQRIRETLHVATNSTNQYEAPPKEWHTAVLCGQKIPDGDPALSGKTFRNWVRQIWAEVHAALPQRCRTAVYDRGRRLLQDTRKGAWTEEELAKMKQIVDSNLDRSRIWKVVGEELGRPAAACKDIYRHRFVGRWQPADVRESKSSPYLWSSKETATLRALVHQTTNTVPNTHVKSSDVPWLKVSLQIKGRSAQQCQQRWELLMSSPHSDPPTPSADAGIANIPLPPPHGATAAAMLGSGMEGGEKKEMEGLDGVVEGGYRLDKKGEGVDDMKQGAGIAVEQAHTWKLWKREDDLFLAEQVQKQMQERGINHIVDIRWKDIHVPGRLPNHSKERWRRLADKSFPHIAARDAKLDELVKHVLATKSLLHAPRNIDLGGPLSLVGVQPMAVMPHLPQPQPPPPMDPALVAQLTAQHAASASQPPPPPDVGLDAGGSLVIHPQEAHLPQGPDNM